MSGWVSSGVSTEMKRLLSAIALASTIILATATSALGAAAAPVRVSHGDPFHSCRLGGDGSALNYRSAEVEPWIADNPANVNNLIRAWQTKRWSNGGAKGPVASWSFDGGRTWGQTPQPFTLCAQPYYRSKVLQYERTSDPWVSIGPDGTAYAITLPFDANFIRNGLGVAVSHDAARPGVNPPDIEPLVARPHTPAPRHDNATTTPHTPPWPRNPTPPPTARPPRYTHTPDRRRTNTARWCCWRHLRRCTACRRASRPIHTWQCRPSDPPSSAATLPGPAREHPPELAAAAAPPPPAAVAAVPAAARSKRTEYRRTPATSASPP